MLKMSQINHIRDMARNGYRISEIAKETGTDAKTVRKYLEIEDFSPEPPIKVKKDSKLDAYKATIIQWLTEDQKTWYKQHHTAKRVHDRLKEEEKCDASYSVVQRFIKEYRAEEADSHASCHRPQCASRFRGSHQRFHLLSLAGR